ncbi:MAG TPA: PDZ domain-containing protein [Thermoanaerobaculia bacterium]|nr:PDZ domain-containing protein [Thermoanaerobaculia bacterium]
MLRHLALLSAIVLSLAATSAEGGEKCSAHAKECERQIREMLKGRLYLGVKYEQTRYGIAIRSVVEGSPAERGGFRKDDMIVALNGRDMSRADTKRLKELLQEARDRNEGKLTLVVTRYGQFRRIHVQLGEMPEEHIDAVVAAHLREAHGDTASGQ